MVRREHWRCGCRLSREGSEVSRPGRYLAIELHVLAFDPRHRVTSPAADFPTLRPATTGVLSHVVCGYSLHVFTEILLFSISFIK